MGATMLNGHNSQAL